MTRLNWGCGAHVAPGWINSDIKDQQGVDLVADIRRGLPLDSDSVDYAVSVHALPELGYRELVPVLEELRRVLVPGGTLRLALPDLRRGIDAYLAGNRDYFKVDAAEVSSIGGRFIVHMLWYGYSRSLFTADFALELLEKAGFVEVTQCSFGATSSGIAEIVELDNREEESLFVEGRKRPDAEPARRMQNAWSDATRGYNPAVPRQERIRVIEVSEAEPAAGLRKAHLDAPASGAELDSTAMTVVGWAVGKDSPVESVEISADGAVIAQTAVEIERPGVAGAYPNTPGADRAGFRLAVQGSGEGRHELAIQGVIDGERAPIGSIVLEIRRRGLLSRLFGRR